MNLAPKQKDSVFVAWQYSKVPTNLLCAIMVVQLQSNFIVQELLSPNIMH